MGKVNLGELIARAAVSNLDTGREQIEYIPLERIHQDPNNFYSLEGLEELAANIQLCGLQQPIRVRAGEDDSVVIVSGHRRRAALELLAKEDPKWASVPCIRDRQEGSPALQELRLIYANRDTRRLSDAELAKQAQRVEVLLYQLKEEGYDFPGRMRDHVAQACKISAPKLARLKVIQAKLTCSWAEKFAEDQLSEQAAYAIARMPKELQERLYQVCPQPMGYAAERILSLSEAGVTWEPTMTCPDGRACKRGNAFLRHDVEHCHDTCKGETCCLECSRAKEAYYACDRMCAKAQALRKDKRDEKKSREEERRAQQQLEYQADMQKSARRLLRAAEAAELGEEESIPLGSYKQPITVKELRAYAAGDFLDRYFYGNELDPVRFDRLDQIAQKLHCSSDYLLGLTEDLRPVPAPPAEGWVPLEWIPGQERPHRDQQLAVVRFRVEGESELIRSIVKWDAAAGSWCFPGKTFSEKLEAECVAWWPIPKEE